MKLKFNVCNDGDLLVKKLMDNGDWEYDRVGLGKVDGRVFVVDLNDDGEDEGDIVYVRDGLKVEDVLNIGVIYNVFEKIDWGYGEDDNYRVNWESGSKEWDEFLEKVK